MPCWEKYKKPGPMYTTSSQIQNLASEPENAYLELARITNANYIQILQLMRELNKSLEYLQTAINNNFSQN